MICSYQFARSKAADVNAIPWDLVVIDEAHRLRNVYKPSNVIANTLKQALAGKSKLLLTATPLQNSLLELFGLVSFIDEHAFGDLKSFREQYTNLTQEQVLLHAQGAPQAHLPSHPPPPGTSYIPFTKRLPMVEAVHSGRERRPPLQLVSEYLRRDNLQALPASQRSLMTLVLRKLLASSTFAIAGALETLSKRLKPNSRNRNPKCLFRTNSTRTTKPLARPPRNGRNGEPGGSPLSAEDRAAIEAEIADLDAFRQLALSIDHNAKGKALLKALAIAFAKAREFGPRRRPSSSRSRGEPRTICCGYLADSPFNDGIVLFNGTNTDERSRQIYDDWFERHQGTDRVTGSTTADMRSALVDYFREEGRIMIATEAGAEGINLQFCSLVVNYDLPWNPQRIEQRIGRCHRYGQKHDVVVVNFLNRNNEADQRVFELLVREIQAFRGSLWRERRGAGRH